MPLKTRNKPDRTKWAQYMADAQNGDAKAYKRLLSEITPAIRTFLNSRIFNKNSIDDMLQDVLMAIHTSRHTFRPDQPFERWMYGIARYKMIDHLRKLTRIKSHEISNDELVTFLADTSNNTDKAWYFDLEKALDVLPKKQRQIITLAKIEGYSMTEIADQMKMSESAVKVAAHRAYKKLKNWLVNYGYE